jgi:hypothetical protein
MKTVMISTRILAIALIASISMASASPALANNEKKAIPVELKFIGNLRNQPLFQLTFTSEEENEFTVVIRDENNNVLYKDNVKGGNFTKNFLLNTEELGDVGLKFEISGKKYEKPVVFEINKYSRIVEDVVVNKLK